MNDILDMLQHYGIRFDRISDSTVRVYGNFRGYSVVRESEYGIEVDGRIQDKDEFEDWLYSIKI